MFIASVHYTGTQSSCLDPFVLNYGTNHLGFLISSEDYMPSFFSGLTLKKKKVIWNLIQVYIIMVIWFRISR